MNKKLLYITIFIIFNIFSHNALALGSKVEIGKYNGRTVLFRNGKPFFIKGICFSCGVPMDLNEKYLKMAKEIGANSIRKWGVGSNEKEILDLIHKHDLMLNSGIWIAWDRKRLDLMKKQKDEILECIKKYKDHPVILAWNLGNENIIRIKSEDDRISFSKYLEGICKEIHKIDPNHPIIYTDAMAEGIPYVRDYMPSVDIYGFNAYGGIVCSEEDVKICRLNRPYVFSEFGPNGPWEVALDENGIPKEFDSFTKAEQFYERWKYCIEDKKNCLGGYAFQLNDKYDETKTWWGLTYKGLKNASYWSLKKAYTGRECTYTIPRIIDFNVSKNKSIKAGSIIKVNIVGKGDNISYDFDAPKVFGAYWTTGVNTFIYKVPLKQGIYIIYGIIKDDKGNIDTRSKSIKVD